MTVPRVMPCFISQLLQVIFRSLKSCVRIRDGYRRRAGSRSSLTLELNHLLYHCATRRALLFALYVVCRLLRDNHKIPKQ